MAWGQAGAHVLDELVLARHMLHLARAAVHLELQALEQQPARGLVRQQHLAVLAATGSSSRAGRAGWAGGRAQAQGARATPSDGAWGGQSAKQREGGAVTAGGGGQAAGRSIGTTTQPNQHTPGQQPGSFSEELQQGRQGVSSL